MEFKDSFVELERLRKSMGIEARKDTFGPFRKDKYLVVLYIFNSTASSEAILSEDPKASAPKFHLTWCDALEEKHKEGTFDRYVLSSSKKGRFRVKALEHNPEQIQKLGKRPMIKNARLFPCQHCLAHLTYKGFNFDDRSDQAKAERLKQVKDFSIEEYLEGNDGSFRR